MPRRSGSSTSFLKACCIVYSSNRNCNRAQSSMPKSLNSGSPLPTSQTFSTVKMSMSRATSASSSSSASLSSPSLPSAFFFASSAFFFAAASFSFWAAEALNTFCLVCHSANIFNHSFNVSWNHCPGTKSSTREVRFFSRTHVRRYSRLSAAPCHSNSTASKPSASSGIEKLPKLWLSTVSVRSLQPWPAAVRNHIFFSSSVSSTVGGSVSSSASSSSSWISNWLDSDENLTLMCPRVLLPAEEEVVPDSDSRHCDTGRSWHSQDSQSPLEESWSSWIRSSAVFAQECASLIASWKISFNSPVNALYPPIWATALLISLASSRDAQVECSQLKATTRFDNLSNVLGAT
mmetsp:Transcript_32445/g.98043  ORF Transcript_32445/g.98043 Transcript_32445/m.98043 type:complete len:348 (-) Transcript_32445:661-1704(-)